MPAWRNELSNFTGLPVRRWLLKKSYTSSPTIAKLSDWLIDQDIYVNDNNMYNLDTNEIIERIIMDANSLNIVSDGSETKSIRNIIHIYKQDGNFDLVTLNDARGHNLITRINYVFVIVKMGKSAIILSKGNWFEKSIKKETGVVWRMTSSAALSIVTLPET